MEDESMMTPLLDEVLQSQGAALEGTKKQPRAKGKLGASLGSPKINLKPTSPNVGSFLGSGSLPFLAPRNLNIDAIAEGNRTGEPWPLKHRHKLAYVVHSLIQHGARNRAFDSAVADAPLDAEQLRDMIGRKFAKRAIDALSEAGVIEKTKNHCAGLQNRHYRLCSRYAEDPVVVRFYTNRILARKIRRNDEADTNKAAAATPRGDALLANLRSLSFAPEFQTFTESLPSSAMQAAGLAVIQSIENGPMWLRRCRNSGRVFHAVTSCPRKLRAYLRLDGEPCAEVDIACAQFFFLLGLYPKQSEERARFAAVVSQGRFYEFLFGKLCEADQGDLWGGALEAWQTPEGQHHRDAFKRRAFQVLLYDRIRDKASTLETVFSQHFPEMAALLATRRINKAATRQFCFEMQRAEAGLVLGRVLPAVLEEVTGCKPISLHDAVFCQAAHAEAVHSVMVREASKIFGIAPLVKIKPAPLGTDIRS